jgi:hypothetical protein
MLQLERDESYYLAASCKSWEHAKSLSWSAAAKKVLELYDTIVAS